MHSRVHWWGVRFIVLLIGTFVAQPCWAHAILVESTPAANAKVNGPDVNFVLRFNVRIDGERSRLHLVASDGTGTTLQIEKQSNPDRLQTRAGGLKPGAYKLQWQVLASDGHMSRGEIPFTVN